MKKLVNHSVLLVSLLLHITLIQSALAVQTIELAGDKSYPPYSYSENGKAKGVYVDILTVAFNKMPEYQLKFNMMAWKRAKEYIKKGKVVGFFPPYYSKNRTHWTKFSEPILGETTIVFAKENTLKDKNTYPENFFGLTVCLNRGFGHETLGGEKFAQAVMHNNIKLIEGNDNKACLSRVDRGMADFYINDQLIDTSKFPKVKRGMKTKQNLGHVGFTLKTKNYPFMNDLQNKFNQVIKKMKQNGEILDIVKKYR